MVKQKIDFAVPTPEQMALLRGRTIEVLEELHHSLSGSLTAPRETTTIQGPTDVDFKRGEALLLLCYKVGTSSLIGFAGEIFG
jgi:hypothetical protein